MHGSNACCGSGAAGVEVPFPAAEDQRGDRLGIVPPDLAGHGGEELQGADHAVEDGLGPLGGQGDHEGKVGVGPDGHQNGDEAAAVGEVDVDVSEVGLEAVARRRSRPRGGGPEGGPVG
jgi:hypothetical protein